MYVQVKNGIALGQLSGQGGGTCTLGRKCRIGDQPGRVLDAERERQRPGTQPAQTDVGKSTKNPAQNQVLDGSIKMQECRQRSLKGIQPQ